MEADFPSSAPPTTQWRFFLKYAVLAPSTHNTQPWRFVLRDDGVEVYADRHRALPAIDSEGRELIISCGVALFYLRLAIRHFGYEPEVMLLPAGEESDLLARVGVGAQRVPTAEEDRLFAALPHRHTNRLPFSGWAVSQQVRAALQAAAEQEGAGLLFIQDAAPRYDLTNLVAEGDRRQWSDPQFREDKAAWVRVPADRRPDGIPSPNLGLGDRTVYTPHLAGRRSPPGEDQANQDRVLVAHAPLIAALGTAGDTRRDWLIAGQATGRVLLGATVAGVTASFFNQPLQVATLRPQLQALLGAQTYPQMLIRLGYGEPVPATPRRPLEDVVEEA